jgi:hypothetical protein
MVTRRSLLKYSLAAPIVASTLPALQVYAGAPLNSTINSSPLIYLTPIQSNGAVSKCQAEVWYVYDKVDMYVCTSVKTWRARAIAQGLDRARIWVGDHGVWKNANGSYKTLPQVETQATVVADEPVVQKALDLFGDKYSVEWVLWESRFRSGLTDGSRVMLRYRPLTV